MINMTRVVLRSRSAHLVLVTSVAMWLLAAATGRRSIEIDLSPQFPPTKLAVVELCVILAATLVSILARPRFWEWDRIGGGLRPRALAAATATAGIMLPALCVPAVVPWLPPDTPWAWVLTNALVMSATVQLLAPLLGPLAAGTLALLLWFAYGAATNLSPDLWMPVAGYRDPVMRWEVAGILAATAIFLHARTCGRTRSERAG